MVDHLGGKAIRRSVNCELLVAEEENEEGEEHNASNECKFCLAEENAAKKSEKKVRAQKGSLFTTDEKSFTLSLERRLLLIAM